MCADWEKLRLPAAISKPLRIAGTSLSAGFVTMPLRFFSAWLFFSAGDLREGFLLPKMIFMWVSREKCSSVDTKAVGGGSSGLWGGVA